MDAEEIAMIFVFNTILSSAGAALICIGFGLDMKDETIFFPIAGTILTSLFVIEFLCWLFHIPGWIGKGIRYVHDKTDPKGRHE